MVSTVAASEPVCYVQDNTKKHISPSGQNGSAIGCYAYIEHIYGCLSYLVYSIWLRLQDLNSPSSHTRHLTHGNTPLAVNTVAKGFYGRETVDPITAIDHLKFPNFASNGSLLDISLLI